MSCSIFQYKLIQHSSPVLLRGAIVLGDIYAEGDITFGPGMTQTYLMEENNAKYPRIILTKETLNYGKKNIVQVTEKHIDDLVFCDFDTLAETNGERLKKILDHVEVVLESTIDISIREKYLYVKKKLL